MKGRYASTALIAGLACLRVAQAAAAPSPCEEPGSSPRLLLHAQRGEEVTLGDSGGARSRLSRSLIDWRRATAENGRTLSFGHEYSIFDITPLTVPTAPASPLEPSANGHLHVLYAVVDAGDWLPADWDLRLQPALAVSSNFLKEPGKIDLDAGQLNAGLIRRVGGEAEGWRLGLCGDHRFGDWRVYPVLSRDWTRGPWSLRLGWPDNRLARRLGGSLETSLELAPAGNRWRVLDEFAGDSRFAHQAWRLRWNLDWRPAARWGLSLHVDSLREGEYDFALETGQRYHGDSPAVLQIGLSLLWRHAE